ncbi:MAG: transporter substrate-binding domain-containing protein [Deltaproteobacteria bacterium]|nr:transporter substrate-binding domain-containing protein [Deltaproteobacteria bacterium]
MIRKDSKSIMKKRILTSVFFFLLLILNTTTNSKTHDRKVVKVGGYDFPPFVEDIDGQGTGITLDLIEMMNSYQTEYRFEFIITSSKRRFDHFDAGRFNIIMFEGIDWGWKNKNVEATKVYLEGGSKYITKAGPGKDQRYFNNLKGKLILLILGYHYAFANFNSDPEYLKKNFNATMTSTHEGNILSIIRGRADVAVVFKSYIQKYMHDHPSIKDKIIVSDIYENRNHYTSLVRKNTEPSVDQMNALLTNMDKDGLLAKLWKRHGIE